MSTEHIEDLVDLEALDVLTPEESAFVRAHADACPRCRADLDAARETAAQIALSVPLHHAPAMLRARLLAEVAPAARLASPLPLSAHRSARLIRFTNRWGAVAAALVAVPVAGLLTWNMLLQSQVNELKDENRQIQETTRDVVLLAQPSTIRARLTASEMAAGARGSVTWNPDEGRCFVVVQGLGKPDGGTSYHVFYEGMKGLVDAGELKPNEQGVADLVFDASRWRGDEYRIYVTAVRQNAEPVTLLSASLRR